MKKYLWIFIFLILIIGVGIFLFDKNDNNNEKESYIAQRTGVNQDNISEQSDNMNNNENIENANNETKEEKISSYSTKLPKDTKARFSNIELACDTLNGTVVRKGETFSLWKTLGCPTKEKGYEKAKSFTSDGKVIKSYGGGICQVSTTIYNAVLEIKELKIEERHEHSRDVVYIKDGKDAAVSFDSADLKFKNTLDYDIKIDAKVENNKVKIQLIRIS